MQRTNCARAALDAEDVSDRLGSDTTRVGLSGFKFATRLNRAKIWVENASIAYKNVEANDE